MIKEKNYKSLIEQLTANNIQLEEEKKGANKALQNGIDRIMEEYKWEIERYREQLEALKEKDWRQELKGDISLDERNLQQRRRGSIVSGEGLAVVEERLEKNRYLLEHDIRPLNRDIDVTLYNILWQLEKSVYPFLEVFVSLFLAVVCVASESGKRTWKFLLTQPFSRGKILWAKYMASVSAVAVFFITSSVLTAALGYLAGGTGDGRYPVPALPGITEKIEIGQNFYMSTIDYLRIRGGYLLVLILLCTAMGILLSVLVKNGGMAIILSMGVGSFMILAEKQLENYSISAVYGTLAGLTFILLLCAEILFHKREFY